MENPQSNTDSDRYSPKKDSSSNENSNSIEKFEDQQQRKLKTNEDRSVKRSNKEQTVPNEEEKQSGLFDLTQNKEEQLLKPVLAICNENKCLISSYDRFISISSLLVQQALENQHLLMPFSKKYLMSF